MQNQTHLCSSAAGNLPFQHSVQSIFTVFTIKLLHEKLEDNEFPCSAQQQRTWQSSFADFKQLMLLEHTVQRAPLLLDWGKLFQSVQIWEEFCVYSFRHESCWWNISNQSDVPLKMWTWGILHMEKYKDFDNQPRNQCVRKWEGMWWGKGECSE